MAIDWTDEAQWIGVPAEPMPGREPALIENMPPAGTPFVAIGLPTMDQTDTEFTMSFAAQVGAFRGLTIMANSQGCYVDEARMEAVRTAKETRLKLPDGQVIKPSHLMFFDSDMTFPAGTIQRLLSHGNKDVVGCVYSRRVHPFTNIGMTIDASIEKVEKDAPGLLDMKLLPTGVMLIHMSVFDRMPEFDDDGPVFGYRWMPDIRKYEREDVRFCRLVREHGMHVWCDVPLSQHIGHVGKAIYTVDEASKRAAREGYGMPAIRDGANGAANQPEQPEYGPAEMVDVSKVREFTEHVEAAE